MNIFYAPPEQIFGNIIELKGQEARHASKALRYSEGDDIVVVDGKGSRYEGIVQIIEKDSLRVEIRKSKEIEKSAPRLILGLGIIKKRDRLEFAIEKAVELGVAEIILFKSEHTVKQNVRMDRLESTAISAMKQSLQAWLPSIKVVSDLNHLLAQSDAKILVAHEKIEDNNPSFEQYKVEKNLLLLIGPEGGFSEEEISQVLEAGGEKISLGKHRLRAETAVVTFLSQFI
ncbi:MAG: RsmE family RNA methyltransferase [Balneolaceae bacterium]|nr:RsmE family RNA methyltransferase [Balneolaceae bacterium]